MQTRIFKTLRALRRAGKKAFIPFITAGDPDLKTTARLIAALAAAGASVVELGVPFSDPMADGPVIQRSSERALAKGVHLGTILKLVKQVRRRSLIPILLMGYYNPLLQYGLEKFAHDASDAGVDGVLVVDLPAEEAGPLRQALRGRPIDIIYLLAPTSDEKRLGLVNRYGSGFVYYVSMTGTTGAKHLDAKDVAQNLARIRQHVRLPIHVGFGISTPAQVRAIAPFADGAVVGSALVKLIEENARRRDLISQVEIYTKRLMSALK